MFATVLTSEQCKTVARAWRHFNALVSSLPPSDTVTLLLFHTHNVVDAANHGVLDVGTLHLTTTRVTTLAEPYLALDEMAKRLQDIHTVLALLL